MAALFQIIDFQSLSLGEVLPHTTWVRGGREPEDLARDQGGAWLGKWPDTFCSGLTGPSLPQVFPTVSGQLGLESHWRLRQQQQGPLAPVALYLQKTVAAGAVSTQELAILGLRQSMGYHPSNNFFRSLGFLSTRKSSASLPRAR